MLLTFKVFNVEILKLAFNLAEQVKEIVAQSEGKFGVLDTRHMNELHT